MVLPHDGLRYITKVTGEPIRFRYYTEGIGSVWDDERTLTKSGNDFYISGTFLEINTTKGSDDSVLLEQGRIKHGDTKLIISGGILTTSGALVFTASKSGADIVYEEIEIGGHAPSYYGQNAYKIIYMRQLQTGSLT